MKLQLHEKILQKIFRKDSELTLFDVGGCEGLSSVRYLEQFPNAQSYIFEPVPKNLKAIEKNKKKYGLTNLTIIDLALSSKKGQASFYVSSGSPEGQKGPKDASQDFGNKSSSLLEPHLTKEIFPWLEFKENITVQTETLDNFCKSADIQHIDFLHMDVQGAELSVLEGSRHLLSNIKSIWLEVERIPLYKNQALKSDIEKFLRSRGFYCTLNKLHYESGDQFWIRKPYFDQLSVAKKIELKMIKLLFTIKSAFSILIGSLKYKLKK